MPKRSPGTRPKSRSPRPGPARPGTPLAPPPQVPGQAAPCPCCSGRAYGACCGPLHAGDARAATAEALMRSRFCAFAVGDAGYLLSSWHSSTRPARLALDPSIRWTRLEILDSADGGAFHSEGTVEFRAYFRERGGAEESMQENSSFVREDGAWVYLSAL
ncbi:MAG TPA: YchJ family metal-binding protein [Actinospica sp.]|nr:YchJ family metal-binding protein [Actinospica sp.]